MAKKIDYRQEIRSLKNQPDNNLRSLTVRVPIGCFRKLYRICNRDNRDLSTLVRQILEEQANAFLRGEKTNWGQSHAGSKAGSSQEGTSLLVQLPKKIVDLAHKACDGLALDLPTLLQLIITDALPEWIRRASKAIKQREQAQAALESRVTAEQAVWQNYRRHALPQFTAAVSAVQKRLEEGVARLELDSDAVLYVTFAVEAIANLENADNPVQDLVAAGVLSAAGTRDDPQGRWRVDPRLLLGPSSGTEPKHQQPENKMGERNIDI